MTVFDLFGRGKVYHSQGWRMETGYVGIREGQEIDGEGESTNRVTEKEGERELWMKRNDMRWSKW